MFALRVTYLTGRVYSAVFDDGDAKARPEWPPHPSRLFSALVAAWGEGGAEKELQPALQWLEEQPAPAIYAGDHTPRKLFQAFVPVNDSRTLPDDRPRKPRTFPSASLSQPDVYFVWNTEPPAGVAAALDQILKRASSLGHSSSLVAVGIADSIPTHGVRSWQPDVPEGDRMRVAYPGRLQELIQHYARFQKDPNKIHRPSLGATTLYGPAPETRPPLPQGVFDRMIVLRRDDGPRASLRSTLSLTSALRGAIQSLAPQPVPEYLSGHSPLSTSENPMRSERPHLALVPLPFIDAPHATGDLMGLAALLPAMLTPKERELCWSVLGSVQELQMPWGVWGVSLADAEVGRALRFETWTQPRTVWSTVTPFVFDRFPKDPYGQEAEQIVREAFVRVGLPKPRELELHYNPWHTAVPKASMFPPAPARPGKPQRYHCHVWARFEQPVAGPLVAGAGRYYGYGFFAPLGARRDRQ